MLTLLEDEDMLDDVELEELEELEDVELLVVNEMIELEEE